MSYFESQRTYHQTTDPQIYVSITTMSLFSRIAVHILKVFPIICNLFSNLSSSMRAKFTYLKKVLFDIFPQKYFGPLQRTSTMPNNHTLLGKFYQMQKKMVSWVYKIND